MTALPKEVLDAWEKRVEPYVFTTVSPDNMPNSAWVICAKPLSNETFLIVNNRFNKTLDNLNSGSTGSFLFVTSDKESYQLKGTLEYHTQGPIYDDMKAWLDPKFPGLGAVVIHIDEVYCGGDRLA